MKNQRDGDSNSDKRTAAATNLDDIVAFSQTPEGRAQTIAHIKGHGGPLYEADSTYPDLIAEVSPDGTKRLGRFVNRKFIECTIPAVKEPASTDKTALPADHPPMSPDNLGKLAHGLAKSKSRILSAKLTQKITRGFYTI